MSSILRELVERGHFTFGAAAINETNFLPTQPTANSTPSPSISFRQRDEVPQNDQIALFQPTMGVILNAQIPFRWR